MSPSEKLQEWQNQYGTPSSGGVNVVDNQGKVIGNKPYNRESLIDIHGEGYFSDDPYERMMNELSMLAGRQTPRASIKDGKIAIAAPKSFFDSAVSQQYKDQLGALKGADLSNPEVKNAIDQFNKEMEASYKNQMVESAIGWTPEETKDYQYLLQTVRTTNPLKSQNKVKGAEKDGKITMKTPQEWIDYYRTAYTTDERTDAFLASQRAASPYERAMAMIMTGGVITADPVYGYDGGEKFRQGVGAAWNQFKKLPEGVLRNVFTGADVKRVENLARKYGISEDSLRDFSITNEQQFNAMKDNIRGKSWDELSDKEKAFVLEAGASVQTLNMPLDGDKSKDVINAVADKSEFDKYTKVRDGYDTWRGYDEDLNQDDIQLAKNAVWSSASQTVGNFAGVMSRIIWEAMILKGVTGAMGKPVMISNTADAIGAKIVTGLGKIGINPTSNIGKGVLRFGATAVGVVPEDILQSAIDNVLIYRAEENKNLLNPEEMSENLKADLTFMVIFSSLKAGAGAVKATRYAKQLAKAADLGQELDINGVVPDADDLRRAIDNGSTIKTDGKRVIVVGSNGKEKVLKNITPEQAKLVVRSVRAEGTKPRAKTQAEEIGTKTVVDTDTSIGRERVKVKDYRFKDHSTALKAKVDTDMPSLKQWHLRALEATTRALDPHLSTMRTKFGDVQASDFDWVWYNTRKGLSPEQIIGTVDPTTGRKITKKMVNAMEWWSKQPFVKDLRIASRKALGEVGDFDVLGYLPHTEYDPSLLTFDEVLPGQLWQKATGASVLNDAGDYKGFGGDFNSRYRVFASNMLWDARSKDMALAKIAEEAKMDDVNITAAQADKVAKAEAKIRKGVDDSSSAKEFVDSVASESNDIDFDAIEKNIQNTAPKSGIGQATHDAWADVFSGANTAAVTSQRGGFKNAFTSLSEFLRGTVIGNNMSLYDWGAADIVYSAQNATELIQRYAREGGNLRDLFIDYIESHSHRSRKWAEVVADKWLARVASAKGGVTKGSAIAELSKCMKWEAYSRLRKWLVMADYSKFNKSTKAGIDNFLYRHLLTESTINNRKIRLNLTKALDTISKFRYRALFYGNLKNGLLQASELNRLFTVFKLGDVGSMLKRMATDAGYRARVDTYVDVVAPRTSGVEDGLYGAYADAAGNMKVDKDGVSPIDTGKKWAKTVDDIALAPINTTEALKNRTIVAALVAEADRAGLSGDEALRHIRKRFERVALAADEMGRLGIANSPLGRMALFLQSFQIRELGLHFYQLSDAWNRGTSTPKSVLNASAYLTKVFGSKLATTLLLARLGYSSAQTMGVDPFGMLDNYNQMDEEDMEWVDKQISNGLLTPFFAGGLTSLFADMYFMARDAYEDSHQQTVSDEADQKLESSWGLAMPALSFDSVVDTLRGFVPGNTFATRVGQMNDMMESGWATSASGNKMYTAPNDALNTILGYLFGRSATQNALQYNQAYGDNLWQTLGRFNPTRAFSEFDPIDTQNYTDWFKGDANDAQQFNKGIYHFRAERDRIIDAYESVIRKSYASGDEIEEAKNNMNARLEGLYDQVERFVESYERKNGTMSPSMVKQVLSVMNTGRENVGDTPEEREARSLQAYNDALGRYAAHGLSPVGTYTGPTMNSPEAKVKYQGSPQWRSAIQGYYNAPMEAVQVLKQADAQLKPLRNNIKDTLSDAYDQKDYDAVEAIQENYLQQFDKVVGPIIASYGASILSSTDVANQLQDMLSTGTSSRSGNLIPSDQYKKDKYGRYRSMPLETVDIRKWAKQRYSGNTYNSPTVRSNSTAAQDLLEIKRLASTGNSDRARALALTLKTRVDNQTRALNSNDYNWLIKYLNGGK